jgi:DNA phosphorothioation-dependent restriction protein DptG
MEGLCKVQPAGATLLLILFSLFRGLYPFYIVQIAMQIKQTEFCKIAGLYFISIADRRKQHWKLTHL